VFQQSFNCQQKLIIWLNIFKVLLQPGFAPKGSVKFMYAGARGIFILIENMEFHAKMEPE
jgi:hypothetical protein